MARRLQWDCRARNPSILLRRTMQRRCNVRRHGSTEHSCQSTLPAGPKYLATRTVEIASRLGCPRNCSADFLLRDWNLSAKTIVNRRKSTPFCCEIRSNCKCEKRNTLKSIGNGKCLGFTNKYKPKLRTAENLQSSCNRSLPSSSPNRIRCYDIR